MPAASAALAPLLRGPSRPVRVVAAMPVAVVLRVLGGERLVALLAPHAVRLPIGVLIDRGAVGLDAACPPGLTGAVGEGRLELGPFVVRPLRWWDPQVPRLAAGAAAAAAAALAEALVARPERGPGSARLPGDVLAGATALESLACDRPDAGPAVEALLGLGPGLTPAGDDVLAGLLVALAAVSAPGPGGRPTARAAVAAAVADRSARTTGLSAALLREAAAGRAVPQVSAVLAALGPDRAAPDRARLDGAVRRLHLVGHSSGAALARGLLAGLRLGAAA